MTRKLTHTLAIFALLLAIAPAALAQQHTVTFDMGDEGWDFGPDCTEITSEGGIDGNYLSFSNVCDGDGVLRGWFTFWNDTDLEFIGDYTTKGDVRLSIDLDVDFYEFLNYGTLIAAEESRELIFELIDYDNVSTGYPYVSVWFNAGTLPARDSGWKSFEAIVTDVMSEDLPQGWGGTGDEDPQTYEPVLPADRSWTDVLQGVDEIRVTTLVPGFYYAYNFLHDINIDNLSIEPLVAVNCFGMTPTVSVNSEGVIEGGRYDGTVYVGALAGSMGDDVIYGTDGDDAIQGGGGNDMICGRGGNDRIYAGEGQDMIDGGAGTDRCGGGTVSEGCEY